MTDELRRSLLIPALLAPTAGVGAVGILISLFGSGYGSFIGLFYLLLIGTPIAYGLEFLGLWYFRERLRGAGLPLGTLFLVATALGILAFVVPIYGFTLVQSSLPKVAIIALGAIAGVTSALTFWILAPRHAR